MSELTRLPDYTWVSTNHEERLRKLETGVHPLSAGADTFGVYEGDVLNVRWRSVSGNVVLDGYYEKNWALDEQATFGSLPADARPVAEMTVFAFSAHDPPKPCRVTIAANGLMTVRNDTGLTGTFRVRADGIVFPKG